MCLRGGGVSCLSRQGCREDRFRRCVNLTNLVCRRRGGDDDAGERPTENTNEEEEEEEGGKLHSFSYNLQLGCLILCR